MDICKPPCPLLELVILSLRFYLSSSGHHHRLFTDTRPPLRLGISLCVFARLGHVVEGNGE